MRGIEQFRGEGSSFPAWLFRIARNRVVDYHRGRKPTLRWDEVAGTLEPADAQNVEADVLRHEALARLDTLVAALEPAHQEMIALRFGAGLSTREVAEVIGKSEAATKQQLYRIVRRLKERYDAS
jgi:RNA polymerase sigma-70 factor, ECF subfamily